MHLTVCRLSKTGPFQWCQRAAAAHSPSFMHFPNLCLHLIASAQWCRARFCLLMSLPNTGPGGHRVHRWLTLGVLAKLHSSQLQQTMRDAVGVVYSMVCSSNHFTTFGASRLLHRTPALANSVGVAVLALEPVTQSETHDKSTKRCRRGTSAF